MINLMKLVKVKLDYLIVILLTALALFFVFQLWNANIFTIPLEYQSGDALAVIAGTKATCEHSLLSYSQDWGMPLGTTSYDFPNNSIFHNIVMKLIYLIFDNWVFAINGYYLLGYFLVSILTLFVLKKLGISKSIAIICSVIYAFLPYHYLRGISHLTLGAYYMIPIAVWYIIKFMKGEKLFVKKNNRIINLNNIINLIVLLILGAYGIYYAFFICYFFVIAIIYRVANKKIKGIFEIIGSIIIIILSLLMTMLPNFIYWMGNGNNLGAAVRNGFETELYSVKIAQLILPITGHRIGFFAKIRDLYNLYPCTTENSSISLGMLMSVGFLVLLFCIFLLHRLKKDDNLKCLSILNIAAILLATMGGFSSIISLITPMLRCFNRISVFIAMFSICCIAILLEKVKKRFKRGYKKYIFVVIIVLLGFIGIIDQTSSRYIPDYNEIKKQYTIDDDFVKQIESIENEGAMIYQMPYIVFPESGNIKNIGGYESFKGYIHSTKLKWSYGAMKGRIEDAWLQKTAGKPLKEMLEDISLVGFEGIYLDSYGYSEQDATELEKKLTNLLDTEPIVSTDGRLYYFNMDNYNKMVTDRYSAEEYNQLKDKVITSVMDMWSTGIHQLENDNNKTFRWSEQYSELYLCNPSDKAQVVTINFDLETDYKDQYSIKINGKDFSDQLQISNSTTHYTKTIEVEAGQSYKISFNCEAPYIPKGVDTRNMSFKIIDFSISE